MEHRKVKNKWKTSMIIVAIVTAVIIIALAVFLVVYSQEKGQLTNSLDNVYQRAFYELISYVNGIEINFSKLEVSLEPKERIKILTEISKNAQLSAAAMSTLSARNYQVTNTTRYVNQCGDYAQYLIDKLIDKKEFTDEEHEVLKNLQKMSKEMGEQLARVQEVVANGEKDFIDIVNSDKGIFKDVFVDLEEIVVNYPALIYDGPFSAALLNKEPKGLQGDDLTPEQGLDKINKDLKDFALQDVQFKSESNSHFAIYNYNAKDKNGENATIQIAKKGGQLVSLNMAQSIDAQKLKPEECAKKAVQYLSKLGFEDMEAVWVSNFHDIIYVNCAPKVNDIVYYPDLVKVKINSGDGSLIGVEALLYAFNHRQRDLPTPTISVEQAKTAVHGEIKIETARLALIPLKAEKEYLTYEFSGHRQGALYYIYIDATTGKQVNVLRVIDSEEGKLLL